jgi:hypothetical protein
MGCQWTGDPAGNFEGSALKFLGVIKRSIRGTQQVRPTAGVDGE